MCSLYYIDVRSHITCCCMQGWEIYQLYIIGNGREKWIVNIDQILYENDSVCGKEYV